MEQLANGQLKIAVDPLGAELTSLQDSGGHEYLWQGSEASWPGQSPILFPVIGGLPDGKYNWQGGEYEMASHGFARKMEWTIAEQGADRLVFELASDGETRRMYPFDFRFRLGYILDGGSLAVDYEITNTGAGVMPFSVGGHPGFRCPLEPGRAFEDCRLRFDGPEDTDRLIKVGSLLSGETRPFRLPDGILNLSHDDFTDGAIILRSFKTESVVLESEGSTRSVCVSFPGFPDLGIWTHPTARAPYICIEPWFGVDSTAGVSGDADLETKSGIVMLPAGESFRSRFTVEVS